MQSSASLQHCLLSLAFQYTPDLLSLQEQLLPFWVSTIFQSFSLSPCTFPFSLFLFTLLLHQLVQQYQWLSPFALSCQLKLCLVFFPLSRCHTEHWYPKTLLLLHFPLLLMGRVHTISPCVLAHSSCKGPNGLSLLHCCVVSLYSFWTNFSHPLTKCCTLSPFSPHNLHRGFSLVLSMWCFI